jgi:hypothetical protein
MLDTIFSITALIGGTVLAFQFVMMLMGLGHDGGGDATGGHGMDAGGVDGHDFSGGVHGDMSGGVDAHAMSVDATGHDVSADQHTWRDAADADLLHGGAHWFYEVISLRTLSAAMTFFGLTGMMMRVNGYSTWQSLVWASLAGMASMYAVYWLFKQVFRLQHAGNENVRNAIGLPATVYVPIPGKRAGAGKVTFRLQNRIVEYQAVTEDENRLPTGEEVVIVAIVSQDTVRVARISEPAHALSG